MGKVECLSETVNTTLATIQLELERLSSENSEQGIEINQLTSDSKDQQAEIQRLSSENTDQKFGTHVV